MLSDLLVMLFLLAMILFIVYHFYVDYSNWSNTGNTFAEGMTNNKQCAANFGTTTPSDGSNSGTVAAQYVCPQELPVCNDYKFQVKWGNCIAAQPIKYTKMTKLSDFCGDGNNETTKMEWEGQNCGDGKIKWMSMKSLAGTTRGGNECSWTRGNDSNWNNTYVGDCGVSPTYINLPTNVSQLSQEGTNTNISQGSAGSAETAMDNEIKERAGNVAPMDSNVPQNCKKGCVAPTGPNGNCENVTINGQQKKKCSYGCPVPTFIRGDTINCKYDKDCNACEPKKIFAPDAPPDMPRSGRPVDGVANNSGPNSWVGSRIDVAGIQNAPGLNPGGQMGNQASASAPANIVHANNALFNENIMTQVLASKNLIPEDIKIGEENQDNFIRVGMNFMQDLSHIRNISIPNIDNDDYESLGRVISKIKQQEMENIKGPQNLVAKKELANSVKSILSGTVISNSQVDWDTPTDTAKITTTGMYGDNSNSKMGYGERARNHHKEYPDGGLCLWKDCEKHQKGKPYDSVWSLY